MMKRVVITGVGLVSSMGESSALLHENLCAGATGLQPAAEAEYEALEPQPAGKAWSFAPERYLKGKLLRPIDRTGRLLASAAALALESSGWTSELLANHDVGLVMGTMFGSMHTIARFDRQSLMEGPASSSPMDFANTVINSAACQTAIWHKLRGINSTTATGATSGLMAIGYAADLIRYGGHSAILAGGADEFCFEAFYGLERAGQLCGPEIRNGCPIPFDERRTGFALAEAAGLLVLEDLESARSRGATIWGEVRGHASACDPSYDQPGCGPEAIVQAMQGALNDAELTPNCLSAISAAANGGVMNDKSEGLAIRTVFNGRSSQIPITAIKSMLGESLGAAGALQVIDHLETMRTGVLPGIMGLKQVDSEFAGLNLCRQSTAVRSGAGLINGIGFDGHACSVVISAQPE